VRRVLAAFVFSFEENENTKAAMTRRTPKGANQHCAGVKSLRAESWFAITGHKMNPSPGEERWPARKYRWIIWGLYVAAWTTALLVPLPGGSGWKVHNVSLKFLFAKTLHVSAYALWAMLSAWLLVPRRWRLLLLVLMVVHAAATEFLQTFVPGRTGNLRDVGLDLIGIGIGCLLTWKWWRALP
jgi:VanZ family protein